MTAAERQCRRTRRLAEQGQVRLSTWIPAETMDALGSLARTAGITKRTLLARLIKDAARRQLDLVRMKAVTQSCQRLSPG